MSSAQTEFSRTRGKQLEEIPARWDVQPWAKMPQPHFPKKALGRTYQESVQKLQIRYIWSSLPLHTNPSDLCWSCRDLYLWGLSAGRGELPGFPQWQPLLSVCLSSSQPLPGICHLCWFGFFFSGSEPLALTGFTLASVFGVNYYR